MVDNCKSGTILFPRTETSLNFQKYLNFIQAKFKHLSAVLETGLNIFFLLLLKVASFRILDARYAYEFKGGHIRGAENFGKWNEDNFKEAFLPETLGPKHLEVLRRDSPPSSFDAKRNILIFHCEFSSVRGPTLLRHLRKM